MLRVHSLQLNVHDLKRIDLYRYIVKIIAPLCNVCTLVKLNLLFDLNLSFDFQ